MNPLQSIIHALNKAIDTREKKEWIPKIKRDLTDETYEFFKSCGEGFYNICFESAQLDFVSKMITLVTGKYSHAVTIYYCENIRSKVTDEEWHRLKLKYFTYYNDPNDLDAKLEKIKVLVLASADENGMNYFDYSHYQDRKQVIMKPTLNEGQMDLVLHSYLTSETMNAVYDYTGLAFWWFNRMFDDEKAWYCSEIIFSKFIKVGIRVANSFDPSPTELVKYGEKVNTIIRKY